MKEQCLKCANFKGCRYISMGDKLVSGIQFMYKFATDDMPTPFNVSMSCTGFEEIKEETASAEVDSNNESK